MPTVASYIFEVRIQYLKDSDDQPVGSLLFYFSIYSYFLVLNSVELVWFLSSRPIYHNGKWILLVLSRTTLQKSDCVFTFFQDVYLMIQRKKLTIFTDCKDTTEISEVKKIIEGN